jgi:hypothetical protein
MQMEEEESEGEKEEADGHEKGVIVGVPSGTGLEPTEHK